MLAQKMLKPKFAGALTKIQSRVPGIVVMPLET
ncbi:hypothetical protein LMED105_10140 [Limnobacter sp. MED105]|nr:hypothetical protein LMED105_10140 [Limnobacter sp. MED105]